MATFGVLVALAGIEHGVGEILQGSVRPEGLVIESWADAEAFEILSGEPAMTVVPNLLWAGILTIAAALAVGVWSVGFAHRSRGGPVLILLSAILLVVGGGFGPPLIGIIIGVVATRIGPSPARRPGRAARALGRAWAWILGAAVLGYLSLVPGVVILDRALGVDSAGLVAGITAFSFAALLLALIAARGRDRARAGVGMVGGKARLPPRWFVVTFWHVHRAFVRATRGRRGLWSPRPGKWGALRLATKGRRSGKPRSVIIGYFEDGENLVSMAMNGWGALEPAWWLNLKAQPEAIVDLAGGIRREVVGRAAVGDERERLWQRWRELDRNLDDYAARRPKETAVVVLEPRGHRPGER